MEDMNHATAPENEVAILVAEDEEINYHFLAMLLNQLKPKCTVLHAKDGVEAVELYKSHSNIQLILMDIKMPNMDGYEATRMIKSLNPAVKIIAQTALSAYDAKEKALQAGCDDFITKPINKSLLENSINHLTHPSA